MQNILKNIKSAVVGFLRTHKFIASAWGLFVLVYVLISNFKIPFGNAMSYVSTLFLLFATGRGYLQSVSGIEKVQGWKHYAKHIGFFALAFVLLGFLYAVLVMGNFAILGLLKAQMLAATLSAILILKR